MRVRRNSDSTCPPQRQERPGIESLLCPPSIFDNPNYIPTGKLKNKVVIGSGFDSGVGRAIAILFAKEGAKISIVYLSEREDAEETKQQIEKYNGECILIEKDLRIPENSQYVVEQTLKEFGQINILINNIATQTIQNSILDISDDQLEDTFRTNVFSYFYMTKSVLPYLHSGDTIINTTSVTQYGSASLIDYSSCKGALTTFTRSLAQSLFDKGVRCNAVAPAPVWTPLIVSSFDEESIASFGKDNPMKRPAQSVEIAPAFLFLASDDSLWINGETININGGAIMC